MSTEPGQVQTFSPEQLLDRLSQRLDVLRGGRDADPRQATLRATVEWSYQLLRPEEQQLLRRLSVFVGGCTLGAAEDVCVADIDVLESLLDKSLARRREAESGARFWLLEMIREYALELLLESGEADELRRRHVAHYVRFAREVEPGWREGDWQLRASRFRSELPNLREAMSYALSSGAAQEAVSIGADLGWLWQTHALFAEGAAWIERAFGLSPPLPDAVRGNALITLGALMIDKGDGTKGRRLLEEGAPLVDEANPHIAAYARYVLALTLTDEQSGLASGYVDQVEAAANTLDDRTLRSMALQARANLVGVDEPAAAIASLGQATELMRDFNTSHYVSGLVNLADVVARSGDLAAARKRLAEAEAACTSDEVRELSYVHAQIALANLLAGDLQNATSRRERILELAAASGGQRTSDDASIALIDAGLYALSGDQAEARRAWTKAEKISAAMSLPMSELAKKLIDEILKPTAT